MLHSPQSQDNVSMTGSRVVCLQRFTIEDFTVRNGIFRRMGQVYLNFVEKLLAVKMKRFLH